MALALTLAGAVFTAAVVAAMFVTYARHSKDLILDQGRLNALKAQLTKAPTDEQLKQTIRLEDLRMREHFMRDAARLETGAYLLLAGAIVVALSAKWRAWLRPRGPRPLRREDLARRSDGRLELRRRLAGVGVAMAALGLVAAIAASRPFDPLPPPPTLVQGPTATASAPAIAWKDNWPRFRGPGGVGIVPAGDWPTDWDGRSGKNILWKCPIPPEGKGSPVIWGDRVFLSHADMTRKQLGVTCVDRASGRVLWTKTFAPGWNQWTDAEREDFDIDESTGWAAATPATDGRVVVAAYATADLLCLDMDGKLLWRRNLGAPKSMYGLASSLLIHKDSVIWQADQGGEEEENLSAILAVDLKTGQDEWRTPRPAPNSWSTPIIAKVGKDLELVTVANPWVIAYDPDSGIEFWRAKGVTGDVAPSPAFAGDVVYVTNDQSRVAAIRAGGSGDVSETNVVWTSDEGMSDIGSPVCDGQRFLQAKSTARTTCLSAADGKLLWEHEFAEGFKASPTLVGNLVYLPDAEGRTHIFELADSFAERAKCDLGERIDATPAFTDGRIYIRGHKNLYCIGKSAK